MNRKDLWLGAVALAAALWALWPSWLDPRFVPANFGDLFTYHLPLRHVAVEALQRGRLPFWNPYVFSGLPLLANPQSALFYPVSALGFVLPLAFALSWDFLFHLVWAMLGAALLARQAKLPAAAAWTAALLYALSPFLIFRVTEGIPTLLAALSWVPWCWLAWASGRKGWLGLVFALQLLSGHGQFLVINGVGMGLFALCSARRLRLLAGLARETAWALALTLLQWMPTREFLAHSVRRSWPQAYALGYSLDWSALTSLLSPAAAGDPVRGSWAGPPSVFFETRALSIGLVGLALALYGVAAKRRTAAAAALFAAGVALALGANSPVYRAVEPLLSALRTPSRWLLLSLWALFLSAAAGAARLSRLPRRGAVLAAAAFALSIVELGARDARFLGREAALPYVQASAHFAERFADEPHRLITDPELANPNKTALYHAMNANGYDAFYLDGYPQYVSRSEGKAAADASRTYLSTLGTPEMERLGVAWKLNADGTVKLDRGALPLAYFANADGKPWGESPILSIDEPELWSVHGFWPAGATRLVLAQPLYPGWQAWLDGRPAALSRYDGLLQSVDRSDGNGLKRFQLGLRFSPTLWAPLVIASLLAWLAWTVSVTREYPW